MHVDARSSEATHVTCRANSSPSVSTMYTILCAS